MARSVIMTKIKPFIPMIGWVLLAALSGTILMAVGSHNGDDAAHPDIQKLIVANKASIELLSQKADLIQVANDEKFAQIDKKQDRMILLLDNLTVTVNAL